MQKSLKHLTKSRGKHEKWSLKDVPIKLLRKPTNFSFLYNSNAMTNYYNHKMAEEQQAQLEGNDIILRSNNSFEAGDNLNSFMKRANTRYGTVSGAKSPQNHNRSFETYAFQTPEPKQTECATTPISSSKPKGI